jgi:hypothetical protein
MNTALGIGYSYRGVPFSIPNLVCFASKPFYRYYKGAPQNEHFSTYMTNEWQSVESVGYTYEGIEGYVFEKAKPGTVVLRRYALFNGNNGDLSITTRSHRTIPLPLAGAMQTSSDPPSNG